MKTSARVAWLRTWRAPKAASYEAVYAAGAMNDARVRPNPPLLRGSCRTISWLGVNVEIDAQCEMTRSICSSNAAAICRETRGLCVRR